MKNTFDMRLANEPFEKIQCKEKTVEIRLNDEKRREIKVGDQIFFHQLSNEDNVIIATVSALHRFDTFQQLLSSSLFSKTGSGDRTTALATEYMYRFYSKEQEQKYGVLGIEIEYDDNLSFVYAMLKVNYSDCIVKDDDLRWFAAILNDSVFVEKCDLDEIFNIVYECEEYMRGEGAVIEVRQQYSIYGDIIQYLDCNEENAKRLYECFLWFNDPLAFGLLMGKYKEWITPQQRLEILSIACECFTESAWEN